MQLFAGTSNSHPGHEVHFVLRHRWERLRGLGCDKTGGVTFFLDSQDAVIGLKLAA